MNVVELTGELVCKTADEAETVVRCLPQHVELTRTEPGCLYFEVAATDDPMIWAVDERFANQDALEVHQERVAGSEWGRATVSIERRYSVKGLALRPSEPDVIRPGRRNGTDE
jgi:quinol monooxygenase YgiN